MAYVEALQELTPDQSVVTVVIPTVTGQELEPGYRNKETERIHRPGVNGLYGNWPDPDYELSIRQANIT